MSSITVKNGESAGDCTNEISLHKAMVSSSLAYDPITKRLHFSDQYFINSLHLKHNMASENIDKVDNKSSICNHIEKSQTCENILNDNIISDNNCDQLSLLKDITQDSDDLKLSVDSSKRYRLSDLFNRAVSVFVTEGTNRKKGWNVWNKNCNQIKEQKYSHITASTTALIQQIRPSTLPAKDIIEESRHKAEYDSIIKEARVKEQKEQNARLTEMKNRVKREDAQAKRIKQWQDILPKFSKVHNNQFVRALWWHGLPPSIRGEVWFLAFGNELQLTHEDYYSNMCKASIKIALNIGCCVDDIIKISHNAQDDKIYQLFSASDNKNMLLDSLKASVNNIELAHNKGYSDNCQTNDAHRINFNDNKNCQDMCEGNLSSQIQCSDNSSDACLNVIQLDISRTFPTLGVFQRGCPYFPILHALLASYVTYKPSIGYVQGMSFIAAVLLVNMEPPNAFIAFCNILEKPLHSAAFSLDQRKMEAYFRAYDDLMHHCLPELHVHFVDIGLSAELYCVDWLYSVYSRAMPFDLACRVWDLFARDGEEALFQTAIGILTYFQTSLLKMDFISAAQFLTKLPENIDQDNLFQLISKVPLKVGQMTFNELLSNYKGHV